MPGIEATAIVYKANTLPTVLVFWSLTQHFQHLCFKMSSLSLFKERCHSHVKCLPGPVLLQKLVLSVSAARRDREETASFTG